MIQRLREEFVPVVGNTHELQNGRSAARDWWMDLAKRAKPDSAYGKTSQGFYVLGADGSDYGFNNNRSVERVLQLMDRGLAAFKARPPSRVEIDDAGAAYGFAFPPGVAVTRVFARISPVPEGCHDSNQSVARDHLWVSSSEMASLAKGEFPMELARRLCRFQLVDNIRGEPDHWKADEVKLCEFSVTKAGIVTGKFSMSTATMTRGMEGTLAGVFDPGRGLRALAKAKAWGASTYAPNPPEGRFPMVFAFLPVSDAMSKAVAPQAAFFGREYWSP